MSGKVDATVLITTRNRRDELRAAVESALAQSCPVEVLVIDDGSTDGSADLLARDYPGVRVHRSERSRGLVVQRNLGMRLARAEVVVSLDDDAVLASPLTVEQTLADFDHPRIGAVAIPYVDVGERTRLRQHAPDRDGPYLVSEFTGGACAVRRGLHVRLGGFREAIFHQGEERDLCVRMLAAGYVVRLGRGDPIYHRRSAARDLRRMDVYGRRNELLYAWHNEPFPAALVRAAELSARGLLWGLRVGRPANMVAGIALGVRACWEERRQRRPVPRDVNRLFRRLWRHGPLRLDEVAPLLGPL